MRRNIDMTYIVMNNAVYGLTTGQTSPTSGLNMKTKSTPFGNPELPLNPITLALGSGCSFVARAYTGDPVRLGEIIQEGIRHPGFSLIDTFSPCVTFNDHEGSTKSYAHTRQFYHHVVDADFVPPAEEIKIAYDEGSAMPIELHGGSKIILRKIDSNYDPTSRAASFKYLRERFNAGEITTGLLYIDESRKEMHELMGNVETPLSQLPLDTLNPGSKELKKILSGYR